MQQDFDSHLSRGTILTRQLPRLERSRLRSNSSCTLSLSIITLGLVICTKLLLFLSLFRILNTAHELTDKSGDRWLPGDMLLSCNTGLLSWDGVRVLQTRCGRTRSSNS